ncbi:MAG: hypothetical protein BJ554DRAFT_2960 [Olpidium bornovanus]|uniref:6-phosphofructo-2-kinase domain-containing protein n=1 Tax=Olpidium bornovanus TaxID=278681 RepID=A0A8H7ZQ84_9FUNG|nr:MAG: hypothetical protein BJ554DRAFT_2960 [Olpidium bornovanus]
MVGLPARGKRLVFAAGTNVVSQFRSQRWRRAPSAVSGPDVLDEWAFVPVGLACDSLAVATPWSGSAIYISKKLKRYLSWLGFNTRAFNVGNLRRQTAWLQKEAGGPAANHSSSFFDSRNEEAKTTRDKLAMESLDELVSCARARPPVERNYCGPRAEFRAKIGIVDTLANPRRRESRHSCQSRVSCLTLSRLLQPRVQTRRIPLPSEGGKTVTPKAEFSSATSCCRRQTGRSDLPSASDLITLSAVFPSPTGRRMIQARCEEEPAIKV